MTLLVTTASLAAGVIFCAFTPPGSKGYTLSLHDALPICEQWVFEITLLLEDVVGETALDVEQRRPDREVRSEEHTSELQSHSDLVCRLLLEKKKHRCAPRAPRAPSPHSSAPALTALSSPR